MKRSIVTLLCVAGGAAACSSGSSSEPHHLSAACAKDPDSCFVRVQNGHFSLSGQPYRYLGANVWYAPFVTLDRLRPELDALQARGVKNLRIMALSEGDVPPEQANDPQFGPQVILPASSDSPCADDRLEAFTARLASVLDELDKRGMKAVLTLNDFWHWSGGMPQYLKWAHEHPTLECKGEDVARYLVDGTRDEAGQSLLQPGYHVPFQSSQLFSSDIGEHCQPTPLKDFVIPHPNTLPSGQHDWWQEQQDLSSLFFCNARAQTFFFSRASRVIEAVAGHPAIMAWQLANEPRAFPGWEKVFERWVERTTRFIKDRDAYHLVSIGSEGDLSYANRDYREAHQVAGVDYMTIHVWPENWGWYDPTKPIDDTGDRSLASAIGQSQSFIEQRLSDVAAVGKPLVIEEFGLARDGRSLDPSSTVEARDRYYDFMFQQVASHPACAGVNFWAWAGSGRPATDGNHFWRTGADFLGDPPHEQQGWYSVYDADKPTLDIIEMYAHQLESAPKTP